MFISPSPPGHHLPWGWRCPDPWDPIEGKKGGKKGEPCLPRSWEGPSREAVELRQGGRCWKKGWGGASGHGPGAHLPACLER